MSVRVSFSRSKCCSHWVRMETDSTPRGLQPRRGPEGKGAVAHATTSGGARRSTSSRRACMPWQARLLAGMLGQQASQTSRQLRSRPRLTAAAPAAAWAPSARRCRTVTDRQRLWPLSAPAPAPAAGGLHSQHGAAAESLGGQLRTCMWQRWWRGRKPLHSCKQACLQTNSVQRGSPRTACTLNTNSLGRQPPLLLLPPAPPSLYSVAVCGGRHKGQGGGSNKGSHPSC